MVLHRVSIVTTRGPVTLRDSVAPFCEFIVVGTFIRILSRAPLIMLSLLLVRRFSATVRGVFSLLGSFLWDFPVTLFVVFILDLSITSFSMLSVLGSLGWEIHSTQHVLDAGDSCTD